LFTETVCVFIDQNHPLATQKSISLKDLVAEPFIMRHWEESPQWNDYVMSICSKCGFSPQIASQTKRIETVLMFVESGLGLTILPKYLKMYASPKIQIINLKENYSVDVVYYSNKENDNPVLSLFIKDLEFTLKSKHI